MSVVQDQWPKCPEIYFLRGNIQNDFKDEGRYEKLLIIDRLIIAVTRPLYDWYVDDIKSLSDTALPRWKAGKDKPY